MRLLVLAGTRDGRLLAREFAGRGHEVLVSTLTEYGAELAEADGLRVRYGAFSAGELNRVLEGGAFDAVIDATHPYAKKIRAVAQTACAGSGTAYFRWERPASAEYLPGDTSSGSENGLALEKNLPPGKIYWADTLADAAERAAGLGERILLTTGSNGLPEWLGQAVLRDKTLFVRVLPTAKVLQRCEELGLKPRQIIAAQGPFSPEWNEAMIAQLGIQVVVAKDSGREGGTPAKILACSHRGIPLVVLKRPSKAGAFLSPSQFIVKVEDDLCKRKSFS